MTAKTALRLLVLIIGLALCGVGLATLLRPAEYRATVQIKIEPDYISDTTGPGTIPYDPYFMETELKAIQSEVVLGNVVETSNLDAEWGKRYGGGGTLETDETIKLLRQRMELDALSNTKLVEISIWDENADEAVRIANAIADAYIKYRNEQHREQFANGIKLLEKQYQEEEAQIQAMQTNVDQLRKKLNIIDTNNAEVMPVSAGQTKPYWEAKAQLESKLELHYMLGARIENDKADLSIPKTTLVTVTNPAVAISVLMRPNRLLGALVLACGLAISGFGLCSLRNGGFAKVKI